MKNTKFHGILADFKSPEALLSAIKAARIEGYRMMDTYTPFPVEGAVEALGQRHTRISVIVFICGLIGGVIGFAMQWFAINIHYPLNVGGRPINSWPAFIPVTFELTVLFAAFGAVFGMLALNGFPRPYHPVFNVPEFESASCDRFFLCIESNDPKFELGQTQQFLQRLSPEGVYAVED